MMEFPKDFFWGAATSAYQVEGDNINCDWWEWEKKAGLKDSSGRACRHYELYKEDFDLARGLSHNAHRFSVEWSRIEPEEGRFQDKEIAHYKDIVLSLKERNIEPIITLHHFTNPLWFSAMGGWYNAKARVYFLRYVEKIVSALAKDARFWVTINEPLVYAYHAYITGAWPPQEKSFLKAGRVSENLINAHIEAYRLIHRLYQKAGLARPCVSVAHNMQAFVSCRPALRNRLAIYLRDRVYNFNLIERLARNKSLDFLGINYYNRGLIDTYGWSLRHLTMDVCRDNHSRLKKNSLGWDIYPQGLYDLLARLKKYKLPVMILENGICTQDDVLRWDFIRGHLEGLHRAMRDGVKVLGYIYWSLLDNFEWDKGFGPRFGLIEVDYRTYARSVRESAAKFAAVCKSGRLE